MRWTAALAALATTMLAGAPLAAADPVAERSISALGDALASRAITSEALVKAYLRRIEAIDRSGPTLRSVIAVNPDALAQARALDAERRAGTVRGPLHGTVLLIKDNIETKDPLPTTAGSLALKDNRTGRDAPLVARLRAAGVIVLGKANLSEWANIRSNRSTSGWSAVGGLVRNPYALDRNACGSSSGSGAAAAASLATATIGTETDGSITCPAAINGLVGLKPTVGLVSRTHVVPISHSQDTAGPMTRDVRDAALLLGALAGSDPADPATVPADSHRTDYAAELDPSALKGKRIGVLRFADPTDAKVKAVYDAALADLVRAGAILVDIAAFAHRDQVRQAENVVLTYELKADLNAYLATTPAAVKTRTLADLIAFNRAEAARELRWFGQERFEEAERTSGLDAPAYVAAAATARRLAGPEGIDALLAANRVDLLVSPTTGPSWTTDLVNGDHYGGGGAGWLAAIAGYPHLTVPMGQVEGLPVGLSLIGAAWSEARLLAAGYAYEQVSKRRAPPLYPATLPLSHAGS
jgi:amidase